MSNGFGYGYGYRDGNTAGAGGYPGYNYGFQYPMQHAPQTMAAANQMQMQMPMASAPMPPNVPSGSFVTPAGGNVITVPVTEESYVENIIRMNRGKMATIYMTYENNSEWNAKIFKGIIEAAGRDHIIISDPTTGMRYLLLTLNLDYVTFDGPINYSYSFQGQTITNTTPATATAGTGMGTPTLGR